MERLPEGYVKAQTAKLEIEDLNLDDCQIFSLRVPKRFDINKLEVNFLIF